jgi:hypothetical protein
MRNLLIGSLTLLLPSQLLAAPVPEASRVTQVQHVLLISIDGMHELDLANCMNPTGGGATYCPNLAQLVKTGLHYVSTNTSRPSDSFPGLTALVTGATPRSTGAFYDVSYDRSLSPPATTTPYGIVGGADLCPKVVGTQVGNDEEIDINLNRVDAGGGINPQYLPRDPKNGCAPVYPHQFIRVNTIFNVAKATGLTTAWSDKHQSYELTKGTNGAGLDDFFAPEINSPVVALNGPAPFLVPGCQTIPDKTSLADWTSSFQNVQCYDTIKVQAVLNWIDGRTHDGSARLRAVPAIFGMNFQAVSIGQKLVEKSLGITGGYLDSQGTPSPSLRDEIQYVDTSIGRFAAELSKQGLLNSTLIIVTAKHGQSPIDPRRVLRIPADNANLEPPSAVLAAAGINVAQALEDDVSLIWLADQSQTDAAVAALEAHEDLYGGGEIFSGPSLELLYNSPLVDPRTPDIIVAPNVGVVYTGGTGKVAEHGGSAQDDRNVMLVLSNPSFSSRTITLAVETRQVAPTILRALGLDPHNLEAVQKEGTQPLPFSF